MAVRRLYEPLCIAFGTTVSSPTVPTYQLYDLPHKFTPRLYMESEDPNLVLREIEVWAELLKLLVIQIGYIVGVRRRCRYI